MTTTVFLVRHGSHDRLGKVLCGRMDGVSLSEDGKAEAARTAERLAGENLSALYVSPMDRARETAEPIAAATGLEPRQEPDINEIDFGAWSGKRFEELHGDPQWDVWNRDRSHARAPGGEAIWEVQSRAVRWIERIVAEHPEQAVCAVSHGDVIKSLLCHALGLSLDFTQRFEVSPASVSVIAAGDWGLKVHSINEVCR